MNRKLSTWLAAALLGGTVTYVLAEDLTLTTYYPSPRGVYSELRTVGKTTLAEQGGNVGIGTRTPTGKLHVAGPGDVLFLTGGNVGIGTDAPREALEVSGGLRLNPTGNKGTQPACDAERRGTLWFARDGKVANRLVDQLHFCASIDGQYRWVLVLGAVPEEFGASESRSRIR